MKKCIGIFIIMLILFVSTSISYCHSGNTDSYGGHYIQDDGKCVGYHYHSGFDSGEFDYSGWQLNFTVSVPWDSREDVLNDIKPFIPGVKTCIGEWIKINFDTGKIIATYKCTPEPTPTITTTVTGVAETSTLTPRPTPTPITTITDTKVLPQTGEKTDFAFFVIGFLLLMFGLYKLCMKLLQD